MSRKKTVYKKITEDIRRVLSGVCGCKSKVILALVNVLCLCMLQQLYLRREL